MESAASSSSPPHHHRRCYPAQAVADRLVRALHHPLRLLHRSDSNFYVLGATGNVYTITLSTTPCCTCPDRTIPCKHILFVLIRVLGVPLHDAYLWRRTLRQCQLNRLLETPASAGTIAGAAIRERFHQLFLHTRSQGAVQTYADIEEGTICPVCLEEMGREEKVVKCRTCKNPIHEECLMAWKRSNRRRSVSCVICRARWRERIDQERYLNLSAYVSQGDTLKDEAHCGE